MCLTRCAGSAVLVAVVMTSVFALAGGSVEVGHVYFAYQRLVVSTNAATLAGAPCNLFSQIGYRLPRYGY
jgi:Flp pilus assembly protein TadG